MKRLNTLLLLPMLLVAAFGFTSCMDDDTEESIMLSGEWTGDMGMFYSDGHYTYDADYTDIRFVPDHNLSTHGWGEEVDYFSNYYCPIRYQSFYFEWEIREGVVYLEFPYNHNLDTRIFNYRISDSRFSGRFEDGATFRLHKLVDYYDWYCGPSHYYDYGYWDGYAKSRNNAAEKPAADPGTFTFGRRHNLK